MIRAEIRFKNSEFIVALKRNGYRSVADFSRQSEISYHLLIEYANLHMVFTDDKIKQKMIEMLDSDEWTLFEQYREIVERENGVTKIVTDIPIDKIISLEDKSLLMLESSNAVDESMTKESLKEDMSTTLNGLKNREKKIIKMYFGIGNDYAHCMNLDEIAKEVGLSRERTRQIKEKALRRLRHKSNSEKLVSYVGHNRLKRIIRENNNE